MDSLKGRVALVTGANRGIGKRIVEAFIKAGVDKVYVGARNLDSLTPMVQSHGERIQPVRIDLNDAASIAEAARVAGDVEIVVNNAGMLSVANPLATNAIATMQEEMEVNVYGLLRMAQAFAPVLKANGGGAFVQLNSVASMKNFADFATYSASKAASYSITQGLRDVLKAQGTQVVSVHPGPIATDMAKDAGLGEIAEPAEVVAEAIIEAIERNEFHAFPDSMAKQVGTVYRDFATNIVEADLMEG